MRGTVPSYLNQPPMSMGQRTSFTLSTDNGHSLDPVQAVRDLWPAIAEDHAFAAEGGDQHQSLEAFTCHGMLLSRAYGEPRNDSGRFHMVSNGSGSRGL